MSARRRTACSTSCRKIGLPPSSNPASHESSTVLHPLWTTASAAGGAGGALARLDSAQPRSGRTSTPASVCAELSRAYADCPAALLAATRKKSLHPHEHLQWRVCCWMLHPLCRTLHGNWRDRPGGCGPCPVAACSPQVERRLGRRRRHRTRAHDGGEIRTHRGLRANPRQAACSTTRRGLRQGVREGKERGTRLSTWRRRRRRGCLCDETLARAGLALGVGVGIGPRLRPPHEKAQRRQAAHSHHLRTRTRGAAIGALR